MDALEALHTRSSTPRLGDPEPDREALENIYKAALKAADHGLLRPWRFLIIRGESRQRLGELFVTAARADDAEIPDARLDKIRAKPLRAPLIVVAICSPKAHPKVPESEQLLSAAAATQNMLIAAYAQNIGAMWRTGSMAYHPLVEKGLGLAAHEKIVGFLYLGTVLDDCRKPPVPPPDQFFQEW